MPRNRKRKTRSFKGKGRRKKRKLQSRKQTVVKVPRRRFLAGNLYAPNKWVKLVYNHNGYTVAQSSAGTVKWVQSYRMNDCYDPDYTNVGHQPYLFDQYMAQYTHFRVMAAKIRVTVKSTSATIGDGAGKLYVSFDNDATPDLSAQQTVEECGQVRWKNYNELGTGRASATITRPINIARWFTKQNIEDDQFKGTESASPSELVFAHVGIASQNASSISASVTINTRLEFLVRLEEPFQVGGS